MLKGFGRRLKALFRGPALDEEFFEDLEDVLIEGDLGGKLAMAISDEVRALAKEQRISESSEYQNLVKGLLGDKVEAMEIQVDPNALTVFLVLGVNGVGKTTSIAKLAHYYQQQGLSVLLAAGDTFRAAAADQLEIHAQRLGCRIVRQESGSDPGAVVYDAITSAQARGEQVLFVDTAGRMHNKDNLLKELAKIDKIIQNRGIAPEHYKKLIVLDSTTGQNQINQAELFNKAVGIDGMILAKYDSLAKGGALIQIGDRLDIPVAFIGTGEGYEDIQAFDAEAFLDALVGLSE